MRPPELGIFIPAFLLNLLGLILIFSIAPNSLFSQIVYTAIGIAIFLAISQLDYRVLLTFAPLLYVGTVLLLILTFIYGSITRGSNRWLSVGDFRLQPSEFLKPVIIIFLANLTRTVDIRKFSKFVGLLLLIAIPLALIFIQPDLGSTIMIVSLATYLVLAARARRKHLFIIIIIASILSPLVWFNIAPYQKTRVQHFLNPTADPLGASYNQIQAQIAAGSGQFFGKGLGGGTQSRLKFLPEKHTDFIYASLAEEFGFVGSSLILILFFTLTARLLYLASNLSKLSEKMVLLGSGFLIFSQAIVHIGINIGILPVTGLTLPFVSVGGSSLIASWIALGIASSVSQEARLSRAIFLR
jgi:rod shape determining protein RodA